MTKNRKQKFKKSSAPKLLKVARDDLYSAQILSSAPKSRPETVLYLAQQCIEKSVKAVIIFREQAVLLTHDLDALLAELPEELYIALPQGVGELTQYATARRYSDGEEVIEPSDLSAAISTAQEYLDWATRLLEMK